VRTFRIVALVVPLLASSASAQFPPARATNLQVLPRDISMDSLIDVMGGFTRALGVRCGHCHVHPDGQALEQVDFALDGNPKKATARAMMRMVTAINGEHLARVADRRQPAIRVSCVTCHRGVVEPRSLADVLQNAYAAAGADSAASTYRALREQYYGRASYDFGEVSLAAFASSLGRAGQLGDAARFHSLNAEVNPRSGFALRQLAQAHLALRDTAAAISAYERALAINREDRQSLQALGALRRRNP
jgi:tetratricopeptide (TPR) repeat protein